MAFFRRSTGNGGARFLTGFACLAALVCGAPAGPALAVQDKPSSPASGAESPSEDPDNSEAAPTSPSPQAKTLADLKRPYEELDENRDGKLTKAEFLTAVAEKDRKAATRDYRVFDFDRDGQLSFTEYRAIPARVPVALRSELESPLAPLVGQRLDQIQKSWSTWDADQNGALSAEEFKDSAPGLGIPELTGAAFADWDRDGDGSVSLQDCRQLLEAGYGLRRLDGQPLHLPSGQVVYWWHFKNLDRDRNERLSREEFLGQGVDRKVLEAQWARDDADRDGAVSFREWAESPGHRIDPIAEFLRTDTNFDGLVQPEELQQTTYAWMGAALRHVFPGFDADRDGALALDEYRTTMVMNRVEVWSSPLKDLDHDGRLGPSEFRWRTGPELLLLVADYFRRLDGDQSGFLDLDEFAFTIDPAKAPPEVVLEHTLRQRDQDGDGKLSEEEYVAPLPETARKAGRRDFRVFDLDADQRLTLKELSNIPAVMPVQARGPLPSPFARLVDERLAALEPVLAQADADRSGALSAAEFTPSELPRSLPGLELAFQDWDRDGDGSVSLQDCRHLLEAGYGLRRLDGQPLYFPSGQVVYGFHFRVLDADQDEQLSQKEFLNQSVDRKVLEAQWDRDDADQDGTISLREWAASPNHRVDPVAEFLRTDADLDGLVSPQELEQGSFAWLQPVGRYAFPGFDLDRDGQLALDEYRATMVTNRVEFWTRFPSDVDFDGRLGPSEFHWGKGPELRLLEAEYFRRLDVDQSGFLESDEFASTIDLAQAPPEVVLKHSLRQRDQDGDGKLSEAEYVESFPEAGRQAARRDFRVFDLDRSAALTLEELRSLPALVPVAHRIAPPHPWARLVEERLNSLKDMLEKGDGNGALDRDEFTRSGLGRQIPGFALAPLADWDRDGDGSVSLKDCRHLLEAGYGLRRLDGQPLHLPSGQVVYWWHFKNLDRDRNERLSHEEFFGQGLDRKVLEAQWVRDDADQNGEVSFREWAESPGHRIDPIAEFLRTDTDFDGRVQPEELQRTTYAWMGPALRHVFPGFDADRDGGLALDEYRTTMVMNRVEVWSSPLKDLDHDGRLGPSEFRWRTGPELLLLVADYFRRLDGDQSGFLELDEFTFTIDPAKAPPEVVFRRYDRDSDGTLALTELIADLKPNPKLEYDAGYEARLLRIEEAFRAADTDGDERLSASEFNTEIGRETVAPKPAAVRRNLSSVTKAAAAVDDGDTLLLPLLIGNGVLVLAVVGYLLFKR